MLGRRRLLLAICRDLDQRLPRRLARGVDDRLPDPGLECPVVTQVLPTTDRVRTSVGHERRAHEDVEIAAPAEAFPQIQSLLSDLDFYTAGDGEVAALSDSPARLAETHQTWGLDRAANAWRIDVFREPSAGGGWLCR